VSVDLPVAWFLKGTSIPNLHGVHSGGFDLAQDSRLLGNGAQQVVERRAAEQGLQDRVDVAVVGPVGQSPRTQADRGQVDLVACQVLGVLVGPLIQMLLHLTQWLRLQRFDGCRRGAGSGNCLSRSRRIGERSWGDQRSCGRRHGSRQL